MFYRNKVAQLIIWFDVCGTTIKWLADMGQKLLSEKNLSEREKAPIDWFTNLHVYYMSIDHQLQ